MHESHSFPLPEVFGPVPNTPAKKLEFCFTDMPCQILPALRNVDIDAADYAKFCLGKVRPAASCLPPLHALLPKLRAISPLPPLIHTHTHPNVYQVHVHAHKCQLKHGGELTSGTGRAFGEEIELYWSKVVGLKGSLERSDSTKWYARLGEVMNQVNADSISRIPALLYEQVGALWRNP